MIYLIILVFVAGRTLAHTEADIEFWDELAEKNLEKKLKHHQLMNNGKLPKNIIFFLGDGMGVTAVTGARHYKTQKKSMGGTSQPLFFETFHHTGFVKTSSYNKHVTDSGAGAMALFSGRKVFQYSLGTVPQPNVSLDSLAGCYSATETHVHDGIAELAVNKGLSVGFATTTQITHATPAALFAKGVNRFVEFDDEKQLKKYPECRGRDIAQQLLEYPANKFKVLLGGGHGLLSPKSEGGKRPDEKNIKEEWKNLDGKRTVITNPKQLETMNVEDGNRVMGVFTEEHLPYYLDETQKGMKTAPRLVEMTEKAIKVLQKDNENGYFLMIEGGLIDMAEHFNQLRKTFEEVLEMDEAVRVARELTDPADTLIIVTADHSHALSMPGYLTKDKGILENMRQYDQRSNDSRRVPGFLFATGPGEDTPLNYTKEQSESAEFVSPSHIYTVKGAHGGEDVGLWADGPYSWLFGGTMENTEVAYLMKSLLCLNEKCRQGVFGQSSKINQQTTKLDEREKHSWRRDLLLAFGAENLINMILVTSLISIVSVAVAVYCSIVSCSNSRSQHTLDCEKN